MKLRIRTRQIVLFLSFTSAMFPGSIWGQDFKGLEDQLRAEYEGKVLTFRHFLCSNHLHFDSDGVSSEDPSCSWTTHGQITVSRVRYDRDGLHFMARRHFLIYDAESRQFRDILDIPKDDPLVSRLGSIHDKKAWKKLNELGDLQVDLTMPSATPSLSEIHDVLTKVFLPAGASLSEVAPDYWQSLVRKAAGESPWKSESTSVGRVGGGVKPPRATLQPVPPYPEFARLARYQGTMVLWLIVDAEGRPTGIQIAKALGLGLDDEAVATVRTWKFEPASKEGTPVPVQINVEVQFRLY